MIRIFLLLFALVLPTWAGYPYLSQVDARLVIGFLIGINLISFISIGIDKRRARKDVWRTPEATLHFLELIAGWLGSGIGQKVFHHKTRKTAYQVTFWAIILLYQLAAGYLLFGASLR